MDVILSNFVAVLSREADCNSAVILKNSFSIPAKDIDNAIGKEAFTITRTVVRDELFLIGTVGFDRLDRLVWRVIFNILAIVSRTAN